MWALLSTRLRRWLFFVVGLPLIARLLHRIADTVESRRGPSSRAVSLLRGSGDLVGTSRRRRRRRRRRRLF